MNRAALVNIVLWPALYLSSITGCWSEDDAPLSEDACTEIGCSDMLVVEIRRIDGDPFEAGRYEFTFSSPGMDDVAVECTLKDLNLECGKDTDLIQMEIVDGSAGFSATLLAAWESVTLRVELDDRILGERVLQPDYQIVTPNGPDCEPTCLQASVAIDVEG